MPRRRASLELLDAKDPRREPMLLSKAINICDWKFGFLSISPLEQLFSAVRYASRSLMPTRSHARHAATSRNVGAVLLMALAQPELDQPSRFAAFANSQMMLKARSAPRRSRRWRGASTRSRAWQRRSRPARFNVALVSAHLSFGCVDHISARSNSSFAREDRRNLCQWKVCGAWSPRARRPTATNGGGPVPCAPTNGGGPVPRGAATF